MLYTGGLVTAAFYVNGVYDNFTNYKHAWERTLLDTGVLSLGIVLGFATAPASLAFGVVVLTGIGVTITKNKYLSERKRR